MWGLGIWRDRFQLNVRGRCECDSTWWGRTFREVCRLSGVDCCRSWRSEYCRSCYQNCCRCHESCGGAESQSKARTSWSLGLLGLRDGSFNGHSLP